MTHVEDVRQWCDAVDAAGYAWRIPVSPCVATPDQALLITFAGAYNGGKTSLIKRILLESSVDVPEDLAVGADPTTFDPHTVIAGPIAMQDTPVLGSGQELHNRRALDACADTDVLVLVLTPQLLSAADEDAWRLLTNEAWAGVEAAASGWRAIALNRFDVAGADPLEDVAAYRRLADRKRAELAASLTARGVDLGEAPVFVTAADPFGVVHDQAPAPGDYDIGQGWDGIPELLAWLERLPADLPLWRAQRAVRTRLRKLADERTSLAHTVPELELQISTAERGLHNCQSYSRELVRLREQLRAERDEALEAAVGLDVQAAAAPDRGEVVRDRLVKAIQRSVQAHADRLASLAARAPEAVEAPELPVHGIIVVTDEGGGSQSEVVELLRRLRENREVLQDAASAFRDLAAQTPKLQSAQTWLSAEAVTAAVSAVDLLWHLGNFDGDKAAEAARRRQRYFDTAAEAADRAAAPFVEWMDRFGADLLHLEERTRAVLEEATAARQRVHATSRSVDEFISRAPCSAS